MEGGPPEAVVHTKETYEQNKNQLGSLKEIMMRNQQSLKRKEEEVQVIQFIKAIKFFRSFILWNLNLYVTPASTKRPFLISYLYIILFRLLMSKNWKTRKFQEYKLMILFDDI